MESNQCKIEDIGPNDWFSIDEYEGLWAIKHYKNEVYTIWNSEDTRWVDLSSDTVVTRQAVDMRVDEAEKWAEQQLKENPIDPEELRKGFQDMLIHNEEKYHVSSEGEVRHIPVWNEDKIEVPGSHMKNSLSASTVQTTGPSGVVEEHRISATQEMTKERWDSMTTSEQIRWEREKLTTYNKGANYMQQVPGSQEYTLEGIKVHLEGIVARVRDNELNSGLYGYRCYVDSVEEKIQDLIIGITNSLNKGKWIADGTRE